MCFNTFIQHVKDDSLVQFGYFDKSVPVYWFLFANNAAVISDQENEKKILLSRLSIWCQWSEMIILVYKYSTCSILPKSVQYQPKLITDFAILHPVKSDEFFFT